MVLLATPSWYSYHTYQSKGTLYYGYGEGSTEHEAKQNAAAEISGQISTYVSSTVDITQTQERSDVKINTTTVSSATLREMHVVRKELEGDQHYIVLQYHYTTPLWFEQRTADAPLFSKVGYGVGKDPSSARANASKDLSSQLKNITRAKINTVKQDKVGDFYFYALSYQVVPKLGCSSHQNPFLAHSTLIQQANALTPCPYNYTLHHFDNRWYLKYQTLVSPLSQRNFDTFFKTIKSEMVSINTARVNLSEGDGFHLTLSAKAEGYVSVFNVYEDGKVGKLLANQALSADQTFLFPSKQSGQEFEAALVQKGKATKDL